MSEMELEDILLQYTNDPEARKKEFHRYYGPKNLEHQYKQIEMLKDVPCGKLTEIGSYLGFATALFMAAGFKVQTIDAGVAGALGEITPVKHISKNILDILPEDIQGQDIIVACEVLEHLHFSDVEAVLEKVYESNTEWLLISVPYKTMSINLRLIKTPFSWLFKFSLKLPTKVFQIFKPEPESFGHKWELGFKGLPLEKLTNALDAAGYQVVKKDYVAQSRSVFILSQRKS